jgi:hypothetical protein
LSEVAYPVASVVVVAGNGEVRDGRRQGRGGPVLGRVGG